LSYNGVALEGMGYVIGHRRQVSHKRRGRNLTPAVSVDTGRMLPIVNRTVRRMVVDPAGAMELWTRDDGSSLQSNTGDRLLVLVNFSHELRNVDVWWPGSTTVEVVTRKDELECDSDGRFRFPLPSNEGVILRQR